MQHHLRLQIKMWRQGGAPPDAQALLAKLPEFEHTDLIVAVNALKDLNVRAAAPHLLATLLEMLRETSNGQLLGTLCEALGQLGETAAAADVIKLLEDDPLGVRRAACVGTATRACVGTVGTLGARRCGRERQAIGGG